MASGRAPVRVTLAGEVSVRAAREARGHGLGSQGRLVLAILATERHRGVHRDELAEALWPRDLPRSWEPSLRAVVSKVRRFLGEAGLPSDVLQSAFGVYRLLLPPGSGVDLEEAAAAVEEGEEALRAGDAPRARERVGWAREVLSRPFLPGVDCPWADRKRDELRWWLVRCLEAASEALRRTGDVAGAVAAAKEALSLEPFRESAHRCLMAAHVAAGNVAEALRAYEDCRRLLEEELGALPSAETRELHLALLREGPQSPLQPPPPPVVRARTGLPQPLAAGGPFVGRGEELARIMEAWAGAVASGPRAVLVGGGPGMGKTRLAAEAARLVAGEGGLVLYGRCEEDPVLPYLPFAEALGQFLDAFGPGDLPGVLGPLAPDLARLYPRLADRVPDLPSPKDAEPQTERYRLFEAVVGWLGAASARVPVMLVVDDLQWAGSPVLHLLRHVLRTTEPLRVLVVGAFRDAPDDVGGALADLLAELHRDRRTERLSVSGLTPADVAELMEAGAGSALPLAVHTRTEGNPFFVGEMVRHLVESGVAERRDGTWTALRPLEEAGIPPTVREVLLARLARLPKAAGEVLRIASVLGREFEVSLLVAVADLGEGEVLDALEVCARAGLVAESTKDRCAFVHDLVRSVLYEAVPRPRRMRLHLRVGRVLEQRPDAPHRLGELAHHFGEAAGLGEVQPAVRYARLAGQAARAALAFEEAAAHYEQALGILDTQPAPDPAERCDLLLALGEALHRASDPRFRPTLLEAAALARRLGDPERLARAGLALNHMGAPSSSVVDEEVVGLLEEALAGLPQEDSLVRARVSATLAVELLWDPHGLPRRRALAGDAMAMARRLGPAAVAQVVYPQHLASCGPDNLTHRLAEAAELVELGSAAGDAECACRGHLLRADALVESGGVEGAEAALRSARELAAELRQPAFLWEAEIRGAGLSLLGGRVREAESRVEAAFAFGQEHHVPPAQLVAVYGAQLLVVRYEQGRIPEVIPLFQAAELPAALSADILAFAAAHAGRAPEAREPLEAACEALLSSPRDLPWLAGVVLAALTCARLGEAGRAAELYAALEPYAGRFTWVIACSVGPTDLALGVLAALCGMEDAALRHLRAAIRLCEHVGARSWLARAQMHLAGLLLRGPDRDPDHGRRLLQAARRSSTELGLGSLEEEIRSLATPAPPNRPRAVR